MECIKIEKLQYISFFKKLIKLIYFEYYEQKLHFNFILFIRNRYIQVSIHFQNYKMALKLPN